MVANCIVIFMPEKTSIACAIKRLRRIQFFVLLFTKALIASIYLHGNHTSYHLVSPKKTVQQFVVSPQRFLRTFEKVAAWKAHLVFLNVMIDASVKWVERRYSFSVLSSSITGQESSTASTWPDYLFSDGIVRSLTKKFKIHVRWVHKKRFSLDHCLCIKKI